MNHLLQDHRFALRQLRHPYGFAMPARSVCSQLYGVCAADPLSAPLAVLLFLFVCFPAALLPARRIAVVSSITALRTE